MDSRTLYTPKHRRVRSSRIAYPIFFLTIALLSLGIVYAARAMGAPAPMAAEVVVPPDTGAAALTPTVAAPAAGEQVNALPSLTPTPLPQFRAEPQSVRAECTRTALHGTVYAGEYGVNNVWV